MLRTALQVSGVARALGNLKLRLEEKAEGATAQVKGVAVRVAIAAGFALAAVAFIAFALFAGLISLYVYLYPIYGVIPALGMVGGLMFAVALLCALAAMLVARRKTAKKAAKQALTLDQSDEEDEPVGNGSRPVRRRAYASSDARAASEVTESIVSLAAAAGRSQRRRGNGRANGRGETADAITLLQSGDRRTMVAVLGAVAAVGWLMGRTLPSSSDSDPH
jgi:hypothetical protein